MTISELQSQAHVTALSHGWWNPPPPFPESACMIHSEVSEAVQAYRDGESQERLAEELADIVIRVADLAGFMRLDLERAIRVKLEINKGRPYRHGGKLC